MLEERKIVTSLPENSETPLKQLSSWVTPNRLFFVRNHFTAPEIDVEKWRLSISGCVSQPLELSWSQLTAMRTRSVFATVECAGNGRSFLHPHVHGVQWGAGAIGHGEWTGVALKDVLEQAELSSDAKEVIFFGADIGTEADHPEPMPFARSLPISKAMHPDTLLAYRMNGELLDANHGFPLRLFVPGWYGVTSVKWLDRIEVTDQPFRGYFQTKKYTYKRRGFSSTEIVGPMVVKSEIMRPRTGDVLGTGTHSIFGAAWAGENAVAEVEVSTDGGRSWIRANFMGPRANYSWTLWEYLWEVAEPGEYEILARAIASNGELQPVCHDPDRRGYMINFSRPLSVSIQAATDAESQRADSLLYDMNAFAEDNSRLELDVDLEFSAGSGI